MRIKCPNTEIYLELPGDRTDMKFTCPACHKVHRVTVTISTPGEDPSPSNTRSVTRSQAQLPKKYATGAYRPVVDVPIDASFILVDSQNPPPPGVDLNQAAAPSPAPDVPRSFSEGKTEIVGDRRPESLRAEAEAPPSSPPPPAPAGAEDIAEKAEAASAPVSDPLAGLAASEETARDDYDQPAAAAPSADAAGSWDEPVDRSGSGQTSTRGRPMNGERLAGAGRNTSQRLAASRRRGGRARRSGWPVFLFLLTLAALGGTGYLGWQQYEYGKNSEQLRALLDRSERQWRGGDTAAAGQAVREAETALRRAGDFNTPGALRNKLAESTGWFGPLDDGPDTRQLRRNLEEQRQRLRDFQSFQNDLNGDDTAGMAAALTERLARSGGDAAMDEALRRAVSAAAVDALRARAESLLPEEALRRAEADRRALAPAFAGEARRDLDVAYDEFAAAQQRRLIEEAGAEVRAIVADAVTADPAALERYLALTERLRANGSADIMRQFPEMVDNEELPAWEQLNALADLAGQARRWAKASLSRSDESEDELDALQKQASEHSSPQPVLAEAAARIIDAARSEADDLLALRMNLFGRVQNDMRRNRETPGVRMAWSMLRMAFEDPEVLVEPASLQYDTRRAALAFSFRGLPVRIAMDEEDYQTSIRAEVDGFNFDAGWSGLFHKPIGWMASLAPAMRASGISPFQHPAWELLEGPGGPLALSRPAAAASGAALPSLVEGRPGRRVFFDNRLLLVTELPPADDARAVVTEFRRAAEKLHNGVMGDERISQSLRQALMPVLLGTYQKPDPRDYFDSSFCRRLIEADYLETYIDPMPPERQSELDAYREALGRMEAGYDEFAVDLGNGERLVAVARLDADFAGDGRASDQDPETGESLPRYTWRVEKAETTVFYSPLPSRYVYAFMLADHYPGRHRLVPSGRPGLTEVWHITKGRIASYALGQRAAEGDADLWDEAIAEDSSGRYDPTTGSPGWNYPMHVLIRDDQGDPVLLATESGTVESPDFSDVADPEARRRAEDAWLDATAATLSTPGELGLIFHQFFRYCSDSPLPELPNLIGSHFGLSDTHQTVYESLERRWVGRMIGDCDDLAEFFQVLTRRQGKLSHVMQLPGHAACGYVEKQADGEYRFVVLQTGPVMQFTAPTLNQVVELAYRAFDRGEGVSHMTTDAVPLLLRFADEETRTPFVLSARIYEDAEYAETMIQVQAYWHEHVYSAALAIMEDMVAEDQEIGNIKELGSLYERVGMYDESERLRRRELEMVRDNPAAAISTLLEIVQLHFQDKNKPKALEALAEMESRMLDMIRRDDAPEFFRAMTFRSYWAMYMSRLGEPARAWRLIKYDATMTKRQLVRIADPVLRTLVVMYDRICMRRDAAGTAPLSRDEQRTMEEMRRELEEAFGSGYFRADDSYNTIISRYFILGRYAVSDLGRRRGLEQLLQDGPYPEKAKDQTRRGRGIDDEDWKWMRIAPQLYLALAMEMLDQDEYPELYDPAAAGPILEMVARAVNRGTGLGSDVAGGDDVVKAEMALAFLNRDIDAFRRSMAVVKEKDYASLYDDAAMTFGLHCGLIPLAEFPAWIEAFREFFPGSQHYFKVVYRALDKENYDHALLMAEATARFFPDKELLRREADFVRRRVPELKQRKAERELRDQADPESAWEPAA